MADHSDYSKNRINILKFLEGTTFDTDVNRALVENTFNRFLTKDETVESIGQVGLPDPAAAVDRQLKEDTVHRQTYQLQPLLHDRVATVDYTMSFKDITAELERLGVDLTRMKEWGDTERFNFAPPVDLNKLVNYRDYYWYDPDGLINEPQYITIKNPCAVAASRLSQRNRDISGIGAQIPLIGININTNQFVVSGDATTVFLKGALFDVSESPTIEGQYHVKEAVYDAGKTYIEPEETIPTNLYNGAYLSFASQVALLTANMNKICGTSAGWDAGLWDDAPGAVTEDTTVTDVVLLEFLQDSEPELFSLIIRNHPEYLDAQGNIAVTDARPVWSWLDGDKPEFISSWDAQGNRKNRNMWQIDNKWVHKLDLPPGAISKSVRAEAPIMEYFPNIQLNEWMEVRHQWMYREDPIKDQFKLTDRTPTNAEYADHDSFLDRWVYVGAIETVPTVPQPENMDAVVMSTDPASLSQLVGFTSYTITNKAGSTVSFEGTPLVSVDGVVRVSTTEEFITATVQSVTVVNGVTTLTLSAVAGVEVGHTIMVQTTAVIDTVIFPDYKQQVAFAGTNAPRVYIDEIQLVGAFTEITVKVGDKYYVGGIRFDDAVSTERQIEVGIDPAAAADQGRSVWSVRTTEWLDDKDYQDAGRPTSQFCLLSFFKLQQSKLVGESKAPVFDLFYPNGEPANKANSIFFYKMDPDARVNKHTNMRLKTSSDETVYHFEQLLIELDNGPMLCYKDLDTIDEDNPTGLQTIWRTNVENPYIPRFVDVNRRENGELYFDAQGVQQVAQVDSTNGDWEILSQLTYNASHENRKEINSTELMEHVKTLLNAQSTYEGFLPSIYNFRLYDELDYSLGGTIKEHNGSFDTLASSIFVSGSTPVSVISYAQTAYETALASFEDYVLANAFDFLTNQNNMFIADLSRAVTDAAIDAYESNDNNNVVFGDSVTYTTDGKGIKNWPATIPFLGLGTLYRPTRLLDAARGVDGILHHDGHIDTYFISNADQISVARRIVRSTYKFGVNNVTRFRGWTPTQAADMGTPVASYAEIDWTRLQPVDAWVSGQTFKRFEVVAISPNAPASDVPDGSFWLRDTDGQLMTRVTDQGTPLWVEHTSAPGVVVDAWKDVNLSALLNNIVYEAETRLYEAAEANNAPELLPRSVYVRSDDDEALFNNLRVQHFDRFLRERQITTPYASVYKQTDPFTWNYGGVNANVVDGNGTYLNVWNPNADGSEINWAGYWAGIYYNVYGTSYPHLEPWVLQGFAARPEWWNEWYQDTTGTRRWNVQMWTNILSNRVPAQFEAPERVLYNEIDSLTGIEYKVMVKKFTYVPVNITSQVVSALGAVIYDLDDLFPPFDSRLFQSENLDIVSGSSIGKPMVRLPSALLTVNLRSPFVFGDRGPIEHEWAQTTDALYSNLEAAFLMQPIRFMDSTWGTKFVTVAGLKINAETNRVFSHWDTIFHGDVVDGAVYKSYGLNQWYVNYNRSSGLDFKVSNFREMWTGWTAQLSYQFGCYINTKSLDVSSTAYDMIREDFSIIAKKSPGYASKRADSLHVTVANYGDYKIRGSLRVPTGDGYTWNFLVDVPSNAAEVEYYGVRKYEYRVVDESTGLLELVDGVVPWKDGDEVYIYTSQYAPYPLDTAWNYFVSTVDGAPTRFRISRRKADAMNKVGTVLRTSGTGVQTIGEVKSTFYAQTEKTSALWKHHEINRSGVRTASMPLTIQGVQGLIDFVDGYAARLEDKGIKAAHSTSREIDPDTGRLVSWQTEIERCIDKIYTGIGKNNTTVKQYGTTYEYVLRDPSAEPDTFELVNVGEFPFQLAQEVYLFTAGSVPAGATLNTPYYVIPVDETSFQLASTAENAFDDIAINVTDVGIGKQFIGSFPSSFVSGDDYVEINPFRNNVWIATPDGVVANVFNGGSADANSEVTIYDQYGRPLPKGSVSVLREDKLTRVTVRPSIPNDISTMVQNAYNYIHIGGVHFYLDGFEHVVMFNNYTTEGYLIYDPYIGMDVSRLNISYNRSTNKTLRPSIGGYYYDDGEMVRNLEASVVDMRSYYDTYGGTTVSDFIPFARALLGYEDPTYLDQLNTQERAKFLFWKGMIQRKGSKAAITAFINSKHFIDARVDDFWAYKVADFGDARQKYKPEIKVRIDDSYGSDLRYEFLNSGEVGSDRFVPVTYADESRWVDPMKAKKEMSGEILYFDALQVTSIADLTVHEGSAYLALDARMDTVKLQYLDGTTWTTLSVGSGLEKINDRTYRVTATIPAETTVYLVGFAADVAKLDPIHIVDMSTKTVVANSKVWDPINGKHYYAALKDIDFMDGMDPAGYDDTSWTTNHVGKKWLDTSSFGYVPYDDTTIFPDFNDRMSRWGRLSGWSSPVAYEWVRSTRTPEEYEKAAASEEGDISIAQSKRASGSPLKVTIRTSTGAEVDLRPIHAVYDVSTKLATIKANADYAGLDVHVYKNGIFLVQRSIETIQLADIEYTLGDYITFILKNPNAGDEFTEQYKYMTVTEADSQGNDVLVYYFWAGARNVAESGKLSASQIASQITYPSAPYHIYSNLDAVTGRYNRVILRGVAQFINAENRYVVRFSRDFTLRDKLSAGQSALDLKNKHAEWVLFREKQPYKISQKLWDKMTEALIGYELDGFDQGTRTPVPSLTYALYDQQYETTTRFGMDRGQAFVDRAMGLATVQRLLQTADFDTAPIDKYVFLETHTFDTPVNIKRSLQYIFTNFSDTSVNRMFFEVLRDALSFKQDFAGLFMTSFVALHGIKILETSGSVA